MLPVACVAYDVTQFGFHGGHSVSVLSVLWVCV